MTPRISWEAVATSERTALTRHLQAMALIGVDPHHLRASRHTTTPPTAANTTRADSATSQSAEDPWVALCLVEDAEG